MSATPTADEPAVPDHRDGGLVRVRLDLGYDGTDFAGWAAQPDTRTVQGVLTEALARVLRVPIALTVAGRTDAGVHARGQVAHVDLPAQVWEEYAGSIVRRMSGVLPPDVRLYAATEVPAAFDARFGALGRTYAYRVTDVAWGAEPLRRRDTLAWPRPLDLDALRAASAPLLGEHDFAAYCRRREGATTIRRLHRLDWDRDADGVLTATVAADAFCHNQVRSLVGALLAVGEGAREPAWPASLLALRERSSAVRVAAAHGLTLLGIDYPPESELAARAAETKRVRSPS